MFIRAKEVIFGASENLTIYPRLGDKRIRISQTRVILLSPVQNINQFELTTSLALASCQFLHGWHTNKNMLIEPLLFVP